MKSTTYATWTVLAAAYNIRHKSVVIIVQGVPEKASHFLNEITLEIWSQKTQFRCFWNAETYNYFFIQKISKIKLACEDGVTEVNHTISGAKFLHVAFLLVFIGIFHLFGTKSAYSLTRW